jgi:flagellum-specific peptidoglycan hydrolase FlgJ
MDHPSSDIQTWIQKNAYPFLRNNWFYVGMLCTFIVFLVQRCTQHKIPKEQPSFTMPQEEATSPSGTVSATPTVPKPSEKVKTPVPKPPTPKLEEKQKEVPLSIGSVADNVFVKRKPATDFAKPDPAAVKIYLEKYRSVAVQEHKKFGMPLSILLGAAIRQSFAGKRDIALTANNHFGIVCTSEWVGQRVLANNRCYRSYESVWASFRDHSLFLKQTHFTHLNKLSKSDYKGWAMGLENAGYPEMNAADLIEIIEMYHLN